MRGLFKRERVFVSRLFRWKAWYDSKVPIFFICMFYAALARPQRGGQLAIELAVLLALLCIYAAFGHFANNLADLEIDIAAGKENAVSSISRKLADRILVCVAAAGLMLATVYYWQHPVAVIITWAAFASAAVYSLPPFRLKERGAAGLLACALAERTLPALIIFAAMEVWTPTAFALCVVSTLVGFRFIIVHQIHDLPNDLLTDTRTFGVQYGAPVLRTLLRCCFFPLEFLAVAVAILAMALEIPAVGVMGIFFLVWAPLSLALPAARLDENPTAGYFWLGDLYYVCWPVLLAVLLALKDPVFIPLPFLTLFWQRKMAARSLRGATRIAGELWQARAVRRSIGSY